MNQLITNFTMLTCHLCGHAATALVVENVPKYRLVFYGRTRSARDLAYSVQRATPYPWCISVESRDFSLARSRTHEFWTYKDESFMGVVSSRRRRRRRRSGKLRVFSRMACRDSQCVVRMMWHLHEPIFQMSMC